MSPIAVCIPSIGRSGQMLHDLIEVCKDEADVVEVWDNEETLAPIPGIEVIRSAGASIYAEWDAFARLYDDTHHLAFLNDDIEMARGTLTALRLACERGAGMASVAPAPNIAKVQPRWMPRSVAGTYRQGGICGWAFMVASHCYPSEGIDPRFRIWYGDDDLVWKVRANGHRAVRCEGITVRHETSTTVNSLSWVPEAQASDSAVWRSLGRP
jgi:hypothetical protein